MKLKGEVVIDNNVLENFLCEHCEEFGIRYSGDLRIISFTLNGTSKEMEPIKEEIIHIITNHIVEYSIS
jgi:hypothetical protein